MQNDNLILENKWKRGGMKQGKRREGNCFVDLLLPASNWSLYAYTHIYKYIYTNSFPINILAKQFN